MTEDKQALPRQSPSGWARYLAHAGAWTLVMLFCGAQVISAEPLAAAAALVPTAKVVPSAWSQPELIAGHELGAPQHLAFDTSGDAFAVFAEPVLEANGSGALSSLVRVAKRPVGAHWAIPDTLSQLGLEPAVAAGGHGEAIAVWEGLSSVEEAESPLGGNWLLPKAVLTPRGEEAQVAMDLKGDVMIVSTRQSTNHSLGIVVAFRPAGGAFSAPLMISASENAFEPRVAMNARGDALVARRVDTARGCPVRAAFHRAGGGWSRPRTVSDVDAFCEGGNHRVAIDERGDAVVVWFAQRGRPMLSKRSLGLPTAAGALEACSLRHGPC